MWGASLRGYLCSFGEWDVNRFWYALFAGIKVPLLFWVTFSLCVPVNTPVTLSPREHTAYQWLPYLAAADQCFSPSNAEAILLLPHVMSRLAA